MKKLKVSFFAAALTLMAAGTAMFLNSCSKDPCKDVTCLNDGTCNEGVCECAAGYEGSDCGTVSRDKFLGNFTATDNPCTSAPYDVAISTSSTGVDKIIIGDFGKFLCNGAAPDPVATVSGGNLTIAKQTFCAGNDITIEGSGSISSNNNTITITYTTTNGGNSFNCTAVLTRK